jgi:DNA (cytosine-5)-methyltransferase 1
MNLKTIDLCAGIGGIRRGFELAGGYKNVVSAEIDEMACKTYEHLFHENPRNDVTSEEFKKQLQALHYDVLLAGFPCQAFSSVGLQQGFEDKTKGTIFFDIAKIIKMTRPKVVFLENVQNLLSHDKQETFKTIVDTLDRQLDYHIVGVTHDENGIPHYKRSAFLRNSRDFGIPQNRPRIYIVAFSRAYFGNHTDSLPNDAPIKRDRKAVFENLKDVLDEKVDPRFFLSSGYLQTLENHIITQRDKGYGFGYRIVNSPEIEKPIANTLLATGGSGRERNLIFDPLNGTSYAGMSLKGKYSPINKKCIRTMTPNEWGRLQGFIGYAFVDEQGVDHFSFPEKMPNVQKYKQFGNSVTIPVIEEYAIFIQQCCEVMYNEFSTVEKRIFSMYGNELLICSLINRELSKTLRSDTINRYFDIVYHFKLCRFRVKELATYLDVSAARASQIMSQLSHIDCVRQEYDGAYCFRDLLSLSK